MDSVCNDAPDMRHTPDGMDDKGQESCTWCGAAIAFRSGAWREVER